MTLSVEPKFHPKIIGRKGAVISQIRKDYDVNVQFPDKSDEQQVCVSQECVSNASNAQNADFREGISSFFNPDWFFPCCFRIPQLFLVTRTFHTCHPISVSLSVFLHVSLSLF